MMEGRRLANRFWILKTIGAGGATEVSLAHDRDMGEQVVVRLLAESFTDHWEVLRDACREARQLAHPNIARVFDFHRDQGTNEIITRLHAPLLDHSEEIGVEAFGCVSGGLSFLSGNGGLKQAGTLVRPMLELRAILRRDAE